MSSPVRMGMRLGPVDVVIAAATLLGLALRLYQLLRPGFLTGVDEYDDGVYFGSAVRLVHGILPYRDFVLVHPPGITLLMSPVALVIRSSTSTGFAVARVLTVAAATLSIVLAGVLVRHRGVAATALTCGIMAVYPAGMDAAHTLQLEPWLVLFTLAGAWAAFAGDEVATSRRRLLLAGAALGFATTIKLWALIPVVVMLFVCARARGRRGAGSVAGGLALGFAVPVLVFFVLAPHAFIRDVLVAQLSRVDISRVPGLVRLTDLTGLSIFSGISPGLVYLAAGVGAAAVALGVALSSLRARRRPPSLDQFALIASALALIAFFYPADFYDHYAWFFAPFLALSVGLTVGGSLRALGPAPATGALVLVAAAAFIAVAAIQFHQMSRLRAGAPGPVARRQIPAGACVLTDLIPLSLVSDRFISSTPGCSRLVDPIGSNYALSRGRNGVDGAGRTPAVQNLWLDALRHAQYVWLSCPPNSSPGCLADRRIPWTPAVLGYFRSHFRPGRGPGALPNLFVRRA